MVESNYKIFEDTLYKGENEVLVKEKIKEFLISLYDTIINLLNGKDVKLILGGKHILDMVSSKMNIKKYRKFILF